ncbi:MAG TPA: baseplate J/gp47 family protein [Candidatus Limnocylindrales bacterium]|nr:baseplate J/gp47 family protein [Candidatus Limnocylindrales bacterium]
MAGGIVYLDIDDEITSAASRIREVPGRRAALVLPYGSRVATSRINFRLLSRDALINEKQLAVVAGDSATRALAASAGLPVFASVAEYEASLAGTEEVTPPTPVAGPTPASQRPAGQPPGAAADAEPKRARRGSKATPAGPADAAISGAAAAGAPVEPARSAQPVSSADVPAPADRQATTPPGDDTVRIQVARDAQARPRPPEDRPWAEPRQPREAPGRHRVEPRPGSRQASRLPILIVLAALGLVLVVGGVGAYVILPSATVVVTPQPESLVPVDIMVTADPNATEPDAAAQVVPAVVVPVDVTTSDTFAATGKRVEETPAEGTVRFSNLDFLRTNTIPGGSIISTNAGVRFRTNATITVPRADLVGLTVFPGRKNVGVTAVEPGTAGNVEPNTIVIVPKGKDPQALKVVNPDALSGGTHEEFPQVTQEDVDAALDQLATALDVAFQARLADPSIAAPDATVFEATAVLGEATPTVDTKKLVGQEVESFELGLTATGTVVTVNPAPVSAIADQLLRARVEPGHELVADSIDVKVGEPVVSGQSVAFSATATGQEVVVLDPETLRTLILGKPLEAARELLAQYGDVELTVWPDWVGSIPTFADRVEVRVDQSVPVESPAPSGSSS